MISLRVQLYVCGIIQGQMGVSYIVPIPPTSPPHTMIIMLLARVFISLHKTEEMKHYSANPSAQLPKHMHNALLLVKAMAIIASRPRVTCKPQECTNM